MTGTTPPFNILDSVDSTNNYAMGMVKSGVWGDKQAVFAREQRFGKGQRGKHWASDKNANILISFVVDTQSLSIQQQFGISVASALACVELLHRHDINNVKIKWPNDIYIGDRKAGGILIETIIQGNVLKWAVVGIGLNINQTAFDEELLNPVSVKQITGKDHDVLGMAGELYQLFYQAVERLKKEGIGGMLEDYNRRLYKRSERVRLKFNDDFLETEVKGVTSDGKLHTGDSVERAFGFGEVEWG